MNAQAFTFKPAVLEKIALLIGLAGGTGSGKTFSALTMATGMARGKRFAVIDSETGRAKHYARQFAFDHGDLRPPFRPDTYLQAILAAEAAGYPVIVVDSFSHEWAGDGGILDWHDEELERMTRGDATKRDACNMAAWIKPKGSHKRLVSRLLQVRSHVILCFRAEEKVEMAKVEGKWKIVPKDSPIGLNGWLPICEKNLPFELTASFLLTNDEPGIPKPIKLQEQHRDLVPLKERLSAQAGERLAVWADGGAEQPSEFERLLGEYLRCADEATFAALERRRQAIWRQSSSLKPRVKEASEATRRRLDEAARTPAAQSDGSPDNADWTRRLRDQAGVAAIDALWADCRKAYAENVPLEVDEAYRFKREELVEREAISGDL